MTLRAPCGGLSSVPTLWFSSNQIFASHTCGVHATLSNCKGEGVDVPDSCMSRSSHCGHHMFYNTIVTGTAAQLASMLQTQGGHFGLDDFWFQGCRVGRHVRFGHELLQLPIGVRPSTTTTTPTSDVSNTGSTVVAQPAPVPAGSIPYLGAEAEAQQRQLFPTTDFAYAFDNLDTSTPGGNLSGLVGPRFRLAGAANQSFKHIFFNSCL